MVAGHGELFLSCLSIVCGGAGEGIIPGSQEVEQVVQFLAIHGHGRHAAFAVVDGGGDLPGSELLGHLKQRRKSSCALPVLTVADGALVQVSSLSWRAGGVFGQCSGGGVVVGVDVKNFSLRIDRRTAPLSSAFKTGSDQRVLGHAERDKLPVVANLAKALHSPGVRFGGAVCQSVFCDDLAREGFRQQRIGLS